MKKHMRIGIIMMAVLGLSLSVFAQETARTVQKKRSQKKKVSLSVDAQFIDGVRDFETAAFHASSNLTRIYLGTEYLFSDIAKFTLRFPVVFQKDNVDYSIPGFTSTSSDQFFTERLRLGVEGKLFLRTVLGRISWFATGYLPTMTGYKNTEYRFLNHTALAYGLKNLVPIAGSHVFVLGSLSHILKFEKSFRDVNRNYGDELAASFGAGYAVLPLLTPMVQLQYSTIFPFKETFKAHSVRKDKKGASAVHVAPSLSVPIHENLAVRASSRVLIHRDKINGSDAGHLWGNFEDEGDYSVSLGIRVGLI